MDEGFLERARAIGARIESALRGLQSSHVQILDVRGLGAMMAMELSSGAPQILEAARRRGLIVLLAGQGNVIRILVPLVVTDAELDEGLEALRDATAEVFAA
jgi:4-aminobutyrate aminotransferase-like enzyme